MKRSLLYLLLFGFISQGHSQILLEEAKVEYKPVSMKVDQLSNSLSLIMTEGWYGEFQQSPLEFVRRNFDIKEFIEANEDRYDFYEVDFKTKKGNLLARFDGEGKLTSSEQHFKNVALPNDVRLQILEKYRDSQIVSSKYTAFSKGWDVKKEIYNVKIRDGEKNKRIKLRRNSQGLTVATLF